MKTILMVDDDLDTSLASTLAAEGFRVVMAENGLDGLDRAREFTPDLILLDFMMPVMDGGALGRTLRHDPGFTRLKILMSTSMSQDAVDRHFSGYNAFLRKPYAIEQAMSLIARLLQV